MGELGNDECLLEEEFAGDVSGRGEFVVMIFLFKDDNHVINCVKCDFSDEVGGCGMVDRGARWRRNSQRESVWGW